MLVIISFEACNHGRGHCHMIDLSEDLNEILYKEGELPNLGEDPGTIIREGHFPERVLVANQLQRSSEVVQISVEGFGSTQANLPYCVSVPGEHELKLEWLRLLRTGSTIPLTTKTTKRYDKTFTLKSENTSWKLHY